MCRIQTIQSIRTFRQFSNVTLFETGLILSVISLLYPKAFWDLRLSLEHSRWHQHSQDETRNDYFFGDFLDCKPVRGEHPFKKAMAWKSVRICTFGESFIFEWLNDWLLHSSPKLGWGSRQESNRTSSVPNRAARYGSDQQQNRAAACRRAQMTWSLCSRCRFPCESLMQRVVLLD